MTQPAAPSLSERIRERLLASFEPVHMELVNESHAHSGPGAETHWNAIVVSEAFAGKRTLQRHRLVYGALSAEMSDGIHALTIKTLTPDEFAAAGGEVDNTSPACRGGSKAG